MSEISAWWVLIALVVGAALGFAFAALLIRSSARDDEATAALADDLNGSAQLRS